MAKKKPGAHFVANQDGTFLCSACIPDDVDLASDAVQVWPYYSRGWLAPVICKGCRLTIPVYLGKLVERERS